MEAYTFGDSKACYDLAKILSKEENLKRKRYVGRILHEYSIFLKEIKFINEKNINLAQRFAEFELKKQMDLINKHEKFSDEVKTFTCNVITAKYRKFCGFKPSLNK